MAYQDWDSMLYSDEEFNALYEKTDGFNDEFHSNHPLCPEGMTFEQFVDEGSTSLIEKNPELFDLLH